MKRLLEQGSDYSIEKAINKYLNEKMATGELSILSIKNRRYELNRFEKFCKTHKIIFPVDIHKNIVINYLKSLKISNASKLNVIYVLIGYMDYLVNEGLMLENIASIIGKPKIYLPKTDYLTYRELEDLFCSLAINSGKKTVDRNILLFSLFTDLCLRVSEVIRLKQNDVRLDSKELWITRKRNKVDKIPLNQDLVNKFLRWYDIRPEYKGSESEWIFLSSHGHPLKPRQVHYIVSKALEKAGIIKRKHGPHLLRHSGASLKAQQGENLIVIQYLLGHENLNTTRRYLHFDWNDLKAMVERSPALGK